MIEVPLQDKITHKDTYSCNFCTNNKNKFTNKLQTTNWTHLYLLTNTDAALIFFKYKKFYSKSSSYQKFILRQTYNPWLKTGILNSNIKINYIIIKFNHKYKQQYNI